jgi:hypothetical protein
MNFFVTPACFPLSIAAVFLLLYKAESEKPIAETMCFISALGIIAYGPAIFHHNWILAASCHVVGIAFYFLCITFQNRLEAFIMALMMAAMFSFMIPSVIAFQEKRLTNNREAPASPARVLPHQE